MLALGINTGYLLFFHVRHTIEQTWGQGAGNKGPLPLRSWDKSRIHKILEFRVSEIAFGWSGARSYPQQLYYITINIMSAALIAKPCFTAGLAQTNVTRRVRAANVVRAAASKQQVRINCIHIGKIILDI